MDNQKLKSEGLRKRLFASHFQQEMKISGAFMETWGAAGAGEGNRTLVCCLGSNCSTIELHPHSASDWYLYPTDASTCFLVYHGISLARLNLFNKINALEK